MVLALPVVVAALGTGAPELRHVNYLAISAPQGNTLAVHARSIAHGYRAYTDWLKCRLVSPDGFVVASTQLVPGSEGKLTAPVRWVGRCALESNSGWNLAQFALGDTPHAYLSCVDRPLKTVRGWGPLYFHVPAGARYFNVWITASVTHEGLHYVIRDPNGTIVRDEDGDFDERTKVQIMLPKGGKLDGKAWSIAVSKPTGKGLNLDDVYVELGRHLPPFLAPKPEWATLFAGDWRYDPEAAKGRTRLEATKPELEPFRGVNSREIDAAYDRDISGGWKTTLPFTYVLDYGPKHLGNPEYIPAVGTAPPALLHLGKDVAFNHGWGPVKALGGENQAYGKGEHIVRISPDEVKKRIEGLRQMADGLRAAGVRWVMPYICAMTINGNQGERTGFWDFYDHWDDYRALGLGPRPETDPFYWLQRDPDGKPRQYYRYTGDHYPPFDRHNHRYAATWHSEGFRKWMAEVVRFVARCGYDGCFVDNGTSQRNVGPGSLDAFRKVLKQQFAPDEARRLFGDVDLDAVEFPARPDTPLFAAMHRFWCDVIHHEMATIKAIGAKELGREFVVFPNGGRPAFIQRALTDTDFVMFEKSHGEYGTHPGLVLSPVFDGVKLRAHNDNIFEHKFVQSLRRRVKPIILSRAGWPRSLPWLRLNPDAARLGFAECGAFSGGGGFLLRPSFDVYHDALNEYRRFFETHPQLYAGLDTCARVAVLAWPEQAWYGNRAHEGAVRRVTGALVAAHVLFDYVPESLVTAETLSRYETVVAPEVHVVAREQAHAVDRYMRGGGRLVAMGDFATQDETMKKGHAPAPQAFCQTPEQLVAALGAKASAMAGGHDPFRDHVALNAFRSQDRIVLHLVNYNVPLGVEADPPVGVEGIVIDLPLPDGTRVASAACCAPDEAAPTALDVRIEGGRARFSVPTLRIYRVVELKLE